MLAGLETQINFHEDIALYHGIIPLLSGEVRILLPKPDYPAETKIYAGIASVKAGQEIITPYREVIESTIIYAAPIVIEYRDENLGVDLETMQELLRQFERRIFERIDASEVRLLEMINTHHDETNQKLEDIKKMLLWKGDDEEL